MKKKIKKYYIDTLQMIRYPMVKINSPIFLLGTQGGGLTLIRRILSRCGNTVSVGANWRDFSGHDEMQNHSKNSYFSKKGGDYPYLQYLNLSEEFRLFHCKFFEKSPFFDGSWMYATDKYVDYFKKDENDYSEKLKVNFTSSIKKIIARQAVNIDNVRFIDKSQSYSLKIPLINKMLEGTSPKFVGISRNPYIMILKQSEKPSLSSQKDLTKEERIILAAQHYRNTFQLILDAASKYPNVALFKFKDFLENPERLIEEISIFCDLDFSKEILPKASDNFKGKWYPIEPLRNSNVLKDADKRHLFLINKELGELIPALGYSIME